MNITTLQYYTNRILNELNLDQTSVILTDNLKVIICLYLTDLEYYHPETLNENGDFIISMDEYNKSIKMFKKYKEYIEADFYRFKYDIKINERHLFTETSFDNVEEFIYPKKVTTNTIITEYIYDKILDFKINEAKYKNSMEKFNKINIKTSIFDIYLNQTLLNTGDITKDTDETILLKKSLALNTMIQKLNEIKSNFQSMDLFMETILYEKLQENTLFLEKEHCKKTINLDIYLLKKTLNTDTIGYIQSFIEKPFLEKIRKTAIQQKYFKHPSKQMKLLFKYFTNKHIYNYCKTHLQMLYNLNDFNYNNHHIISMYSNNQNHELFDTNILLIKKKKILVRKIINNTYLLNYYEFQRDIHILSTILSANKTLT